MGKNYVLKRVDDEDDEFEIGQRLSDSFGNVYKVVPADKPKKKSLGEKVSDLLFGDIEPYVEPIRDWDGGNTEYSNGGP